MAVGRESLSLEGTSLPTTTRATRSRTNGQQDHPPHRRHRHQHHPRPRRPAGLVHDLELRARGRPDQDRHRRPGGRRGAGAHSAGDHAPALRWQWHRPAHGQAGVAPGEPRQPAALGRGSALLKPSGGRTRGGVCNNAPPHRTFSHQVLVNKSL